MYHSNNEHVKFVVASLVILTIGFIGAVAGAAASNESLNKDHRTALPSMAPQTAPVHTVIVDHSDLPTRFGDEDDVIESKSADKKSTDHNGNNSKKGKC